MSTTEENQTITESEATPFDSELIFGLEDRPPVLIAFFAALQHMLASIVGIVTPPIIISNALGLDVSDASYIISMTLLVSGIATFVQAKRWGRWVPGYLPCREQVSHLSAR